MTRDARQRGRSRPRSSPTAGWLPFLTGLAIGTFVAFLVYLYGQFPGLVGQKPTANSTVAEPGARTVQGGASTSPTSLAQPDKKEEKPRFDFYTILPESEVKVPDWQASEERPAGASPALEPGSYMLQVGSFQRLEEADRAKAELALLGIDAGIQQVTIKPGDVWYRVRVGPVTDTDALNRTRKLLADAGKNFMLLQIKPGATH